MSPLAAPPLLLLGSTVPALAALLLSAAASHLVLLLYPKRVCFDSPAPSSAMKSSRKSHFRD